MYRIVYKTDTGKIETCRKMNDNILALQLQQGSNLASIDGYVPNCAEYKIDLDTLDSYSQATYPDLRKCINLVQQNVVDGVLQKPQEGDQASSDWMLSAIEMFKAGQYKEARTLICSQARPEEYDDIYKFMYRNLDLWGNTDQQQDQAIVIIRNGMAKSSLCADPEINLSATMVELQLNSM